MESALYGMAHAVSVTMRCSILSWFLDRGYRWVLDCVPREFNSSISKNKGTYPATLSQTLNLANLSAFSPVAGVVNLVRPTRVYHAVAALHGASHTDRLGRTPFVTFRVSRRPRKMYCGHARLCVCVCVCVSAAASPHYCTDPDVTWGSGKGCP